MDIVTTLSAWYPASTRSNDTSVRTSRPAPVSNKRAEAISITTSAGRTYPARSEDPRAPVFTASKSGTRAACHTGASPTIKAVSAVTTTANTNTRQSIVSVIDAGSGAICTDIQQFGARVLVVEAATS